MKTTLIVAIFDVIHVFLTRLWYYLKDAIMDNEFNSSSEASSSLYLNRISNSQFSTNKHSEET
jgi:hypothetical protein